MTKREKLLLQILVCVTVVGLLTVYLLLPAIKTYIKLNTQKEESQELKTDMELILSTEGLEEGKISADRKASEIYTFFNGKLNSYNINDMFDEMVVKNNLEINAISIGKYTELSDDTIIPKEEISEEDMLVDEFEEFEEFEDIPNYLLGCDITVNVMGEYENILNLISDINKSSQCLIINNCTYTKTNAYIGDASDNEETDYYTASIQMTLYGIKPYEKAGDAK